MEEPAAADPALPSCRNCGVPAPGAYCPACGQETRTRSPTFVQFMREAGGRYVALDGRLWRTLAALLFRPGFLTREYFAGRRRRYIRPARLFLVASLLMFAAFRIVADFGHLDVLQFDAADQAATPANEDKSGSGIHFDDDGSFGADVLEIPTLKKRIERFNHLSRQEKQAQITDGVLRYGPYAMIVLLPAFALLLKILYLGRRRRYPLRPRLYAEHIVFAAHDHAFLFLAIIAATVFIGLARAAVIVWMMVYVIWSLRVVYGGSWLGIAARLFVLLISYTVLFALSTAALVVAAVLLR